MNITANLKDLYKRASLVSNCQLIRQSRGGYRKAGPLGSTHSPKRVIIINGMSFSYGGARQYLTALED